MRRRISKKEIQDQLSWKQVLAYGKNKAKQLGIKSEDDIQRIVDEYRRGDLSPYRAPSRRPSRKSPNTEI